MGLAWSMCGTLGWPLRTQSVGPRPALESVSKLQEEASLGRPQVTATKRQREQKKRERQQAKLERRAQRKSEAVKGGENSPDESPVANPDEVA